MPFSNAYLESFIFLSVSFDQTPNFSPNKIRDLIKRNNWNRKVWLEQRKKYLSACADVLSLEKLATIDNKSAKEKEELKKTLAHIKFAAMRDAENGERGPIFLMGKINPEPEAKVLYASIALFLLGEKSELHTLMYYLYQKKEDFTKFCLIAYHVLKLAFADLGIFSKNAFATRQEIERLISWLDENNVHLLWNEELLSYECPNKVNS